MIVAACALFVASAQRPMVTLSHNSELSFYTTLSAFDDALANAEDGDIIYLSEGNFSTTENNINITKKISVVGCGYNSRFLVPVTVSLEKNGVELPGPLFDGVCFTKLSFNTSYFESVENIEIRRCVVSEIWGADSQAVNVLINSCDIEKYNVNGNSGHHTQIINSKIGLLTGSSYMTTVINSNIRDVGYLPRTIISSIFTNERKGFDTTGDHTILNSLIPSSVSDNYSVYPHECYIIDSSEGVLDENLDCSLDLVANGYLGEDGTVVGIMGGESPFSENPSVPTVDSAKSSVEYDAENKKLKVAITVAEN